MTVTELLDEITQWELPKASSTSDLAYLCKVKGDLIGYVVANCYCTPEEQEDAATRRLNVTLRYSALRDYAFAHEEELTTKKLSYLSIYNYKAMQHRYGEGEYWKKIKGYMIRANQM